MNHASILQYFQNRPNQTIELETVYPDGRKELEYLKLNPNRVDIPELVSNIYRASNPDLINIHFRVKNGTSSRVWHTITTTKNEFMSSSTSTQMQPANQANNGQNQAPPFQTNDQTANYIIWQANQQIHELRDLIRDQKDAIKIAQDSERQAKEKVAQLEFDLKVIHRENEIDNRAKDQERKGTLGGIQEVVSGLPPEVLMTGMNLLSQLINKNPQQNQLTGAAPDILSKLPEHKRAWVLSIAQYFDKQPDHVVAEMWRIFNYAASSEQNRVSMLSMIGHG